MKSAKTARERTLSKYEDDPVFEYIFDEIDRAINLGKFSTRINIDDRDSDRLLAIKIILCERYLYQLELESHSNEYSTYSIAW